MLEDYMMFMGPASSNSTKIHPDNQLYHKFTTKQWNKKKKNRKIASKSRKLNRKK